MSDTKRAAAHTPGPWEVSSLDGRTVHKPDGLWIEELSRERVPRWKGIAVVHCHLDPGESAANARLIAAAPDLLAACLKAFEALRPLFNVRQSPSANQPNLALLAANDALSEALAKAEGKPA